MSKYFIIRWNFTLSSHASSRISRASEEIVLFLSCSWVTSNSIPQLLKNSTLALNNTLKCFVAYSLQAYKDKWEHLKKKKKPSTTIKLHYRQSIWLCFRIVLHLKRAERLELTVLALDTNIFFSLSIIKYCIYLDASKHSSLYKNMGTVVEFSGQTKI